MRLRRFDKIFDQWLDDAVDRKWAFREGGSATISSDASLHGHLPVCAGHQGGDHVTSETHKKYF